jgi:creatinine deaminase
VLVRDGEIIGRGHNRRVQQNNPIMHAEIDCLQNAGRIGKYDQTVLYSTLMPCYLCAGAVVQFGIKKVVAGESKTFSGAQQFLKSKGIEVVDLDLKECKELMTRFIQANSNLWHEDIGDL